MSRGFMGKVWDGGTVAFELATWRALIRVLKPGGHLVACGGTRTYHRMACAIEDAGFEIRDTISWTLLARDFRNRMMLGNRNLVCEGDNCVAPAIACATCGTLVHRPPSRIKRTMATYCSYSCRSKTFADRLRPFARNGLGKKRPGKGLRGPLNPAWKGGATYRHRKGNYVSVRYVRCPPELILMARTDGYVMEHRLVMAQISGRPLLRTECVHHIDHQPLNNMPSNLELWPCNRSHKSAEHGRVVERCGKPIVPDGLGTALKPACELIVSGAQAVERGHRGGQRAAMGNRRDQCGWVQGWHRKRPVATAMPAQDDVNGTIWQQVRRAQRTTVRDARPLACQRRARRQRRGHGGVS